MAKGLRLTLLSNRAEALLQTRGHEAVTGTAAANDAEVALGVDPVHAKSRRRLRRAEATIERAEAAEAAAERHEAEAEAVQEQLVRGLNEGRKFEEGELEDLLRRGTAACGAAALAYAP